MIKFVCPCCGEAYNLQLDTLADYEKMLCSCGRKLLHVSGKVYLYAWKTSDHGDVHSIACPHCLRHFEFPKSYKGVYPCPACGKPFYTTANLPDQPENVVPAQGMPFSAVTFQPPEPQAPEPVAAIPEDNDMPEPPTAANIPEPPEMFDQPPVQAAVSTQPSQVDRMQDLIRMSSELASVPQIPELNKDLKVGLPRPKSGVLGIFIGIAEKLCGN